MARESRDPANDDSLTGTFKEVLRKFLQGTDDMLPAMVQQYDRANNVATVQPLIQLVDTEGQTFNRAPLANVPVLLLGGGNFFVSFHLPAGSLGWIKANDRDTSLFLQQHANNRPNTARLHSFEDAVFIPDIMTGYTIAGEDQQAAVIQSADGTVRLSLTDARIKLTAPRVEIDAPVSDISGTLTVGGLTTLNAGAVVNGATTLNGPTTNTGGLSIDGIAFGSHTHSQGSDSRGDTEQDTNPPQ